MVAIILAAFDERGAIGFVEVAVEDLCWLALAARAVPLDIDGVAHE